ncbi:putative protein OS=Bosea thiooxidans OX=53254 GN=SAMN05660750_01021 PE=4 SV=1 [Bosea thiooxidans]|uniref:Uncharacterized protein n=2 Tax=Bosea thiooxidans TaxID=53254 RepID=A0A1T5BUQ0_9HYPH|nr:hypothetical protein [Bosea thiooxidans]SKB50580.1 hypothetical protein SAMN05660750_01021 [Bosea thiooxidans]
MNPLPGWEFHKPRAVASLAASSSRDITTMKTRVERDSDERASEPATDIEIETEADALRAERRVDALRAGSRSEDEEDELKSLERALVRWRA